MLNRLEDDGDISSADVKLFYTSARQFYTKAAYYALDNLPINDPVLQDFNYEKGYTGLLTSGIFCCKVQLLVMVTYSYDK